ncbi:hypothetical protein [Nostoc favosum]|uniref:Uncharacterized protein n=1 Tax=Nostoc favosum CHAB5714 TaxID=2780399 RepID=A0ABS8I4N0_9NOSO|nr:hypothetical protein [Nostoc favosum]MCC5599133.1 hypothetical protein [Nostoc favosum CHAB5714]
MRSNIISFRFSDEELEALQAFQTPKDKSPSQTAARLLRGMLAGIIEPSTVSSTGVDIQELVRQEVENAIANSEQLKEMIAANTAYLATGINEIKHEVDERLGELSA